MWQFSILIFCLDSKDSGSLGDGGITTWKVPGFLDHLGRFCEWEINSYYLQATQSWYLNKADWNQELVFQMINYTDKLKAKLTKMKRERAEICQIRNEEEKYKVEDLPDLEKAEP